MVLFELVARIRYDLKKHGIKYVLKYLYTLFIGLATYPYYLFKDDYFFFNCSRLNYFYHWYNITHMNERCIEIPIIVSFIEREKGNILEVGNVLSHYYPVKHTIIDKFETGNGIVNSDILDYVTHEKFNLIVSISTFEHIGWDETNDTQKLDKAIEKCVALLKDNGKLIVTMPVGYNPYIVPLIDTTNPFDEMYFYKRNRRNKWGEVKWEEIRNLKYNEPYPYSNGVLIGIKNK